MFGYQIYSTFLEIFSKTLDFHNQFVIIGHILQFFVVWDDFWVTYIIQC